METVEHYLNSQSFVATRLVALTDKPCFIGSVKVGVLDVQLELRFNEGTYDFPKAYLVEWKHDPELRKVFGYRHINSEGRICYVDESRTWWDSSMAARLMAGVLQRIKSLLFDNLNGAPSSDVIALDFLGYWDREKSLYVGNVPKNGLVFQQVQLQSSDTQWLIESGVKPWIRVDIEKSPYTSWLAFYLPQAPALLNKHTWPPKTLSQIFDWMENNCPKSVDRLIKKIKQIFFSKGKGKQSGYSVKIGVMLLWPSNKGMTEIGCGFSFTVPEIPAMSMSHNRIKQAKITLRTDKVSIKRFSLSQADPNYIQTRNTLGAGAFLKNKSVVLIGAGTIGGHLAKLLCAHGAGWGSNGKLHIIDPDIYSVENIGRHFLGAASLNRPKAQALTEQLMSDFPFLRIESHSDSITNKWKLLSNSSVVIDATGSQTVSIAIPDFLKKKGLTPVVLHSWVHGHGSATVAFLQDSKKLGGACFRCLWKLENDTYIPRYPLGKKPDEDAPTFVGCHQSYHPYASTISMMAATQAMGLLHDHLLGKADKTLRFQIIQHDLCQNRPNTSPSSSSSCPICNR
jgi:molybdopterin/thiamine biosynthesis adenylyltransferase